MGYSNVMVYREGIMGWARAGLPLAASTAYPEVDVPLINALELAGLDRSQAVLLDIRPANHFAKGHIQGAVNIDLEDLHQKLDLLSQDKQIVLIDHKGKLTLTTGRFLAGQGYQQIVRLDGGFNGWVKDGRPIFK